MSGFAAQKAARKAALNAARDAARKAAPKARWLKRQRIAENKRQRIAENKRNNLHMRNTMEGWARYQQQQQQLAQDARNAFRNVLMVHLGIPSVRENGLIWATANCVVYKTAEQLVYIKKHQSASELAVAVSAAKKLAAEQFPLALAAKRREWSNVPVMCALYADTAAYKKCVCSV